MPVYKFRTLKEASVALWASPDDPRLPDRIRGWWGFCARFARTETPRGIRKFATLDEANAEQESWKVTLLGDRNPPWPGGPAAQ